MTLLWSGPDGGPLLVLAHGAGAPMDSPFMQAIASLLAAEGVRVARFEFAYMAGRRTDGRKRPPSPKPALIAEFLAVLESLPKPLFVGGKSLGSRIACEAAIARRDAVKGIVCLGFPFHPPGHPEKERDELLRTAPIPSLVVQGESDPFGTRAEAASLKIPKSASLEWIIEANHDLVPPKRTGVSRDEAWRQAAIAIAAFCRQHR
ncbi:MAG: alpha/beta fold hydrolase [Hyphomicrobiales bacterium]